MKNILKQKYLNHKELVHNFLWRGLQIFSKQGISFIIFFLVSKLLTSYEFGIYNYILAIIFFLIMFGDFGISAATSKYVAEYNEVDKFKLRSVLFNSFFIIFVVTLIVISLTLLFGPIYLKDKYEYVILLLPIIFLSPMIAVYDGIYRGLKRFKELALISVSVGFFSVILVYYLIYSYGLIGALLAQNIFYITLLLSLALRYKDFDYKFNKKIINEIGSYGIIYGFATLGYYLFSRVDILILGHYGYINEIGVYEVLNKIFMILFMPFSILGQVIAPNFTVFFSKKEYSKILLKFKKYLAISLITALLFALVTYFTFPFIIKFFFANYYNELFFKLLLPSVLIYSLQVYTVYINSGIIVATGHAKLMTYLNFWIGGFNLILALILVKLFGFIGVIYATVFSLIIGTVVLHTQYYLNLKKLINHEE